MDQCLRNIIQDYPIDLNDEAVLQAPISHAKQDGVNFFLINQTDYIQQVLQNKNGIYQKEGPFVKYLKMFAGLGLAATEGKQWERQRQSLRPGFGKQHIEKMTEKLIETTLRYINDLDRHLDASGIVDIHHALMTLTLKIMGESLFSVELTNEQAEAILAGETAANFASSKLVNLSEEEKKASVFLSSEYEKSKKILDDFAYQTIENRRKSAEQPEDLLKLLLDSQKENAEITDLEIRDQIISFFNGGHDTCGQNLTWACYLLSQHKDVEEKLRAEVNAVVGDRDFQFSDLEKLAFPQMVFKESLRLFPPAHIINRVPICDDNIGGKAIPANSVVSISAWVTHRNPHYWKDPFIFDPTRFSKNSPPSPGFIPFGGGPRVCIGQALAMREGPFILAALVRRYSLELPPKQRVQAYGSLTLTPRYGLKLKLNRI